MPETQRETNWQQITLFLFTFGVLVLCALILQPFFAALLGAAVLAVVTQRPYDWLATKIRNPSLCAAVALLAVVLAVIIPAFFLAQDLTQQAIAAVAAFRDDANQQKVNDFIGRHPAIAEKVRTFTDSIDLNNAARTTAAYVGSHLASILGGSARVITQSVVMLFILFFLFRDRALALRFLRSLLPLRDDERTELLHRLDDTVYATALGRLAIAAIQGVLAGLAFWLLGVPGPILWAFTTAIMAMVPAFGAFLVWGPIAVYLGLSGHWGKAAILALWGGVIVSLIDNFLYPILVGTRLRAHTVTILISILGGITLFGIAGIILGPVTFTLAATLIDFWRTRSSDSPRSIGA
ncbi:MAG: family transporter [Acidobacteriaceae bacterium]|nr:family transporter [Acidobacteriaceae bacterium]